MKRANGTGSVHKYGGPAKRRKPWRARVTGGWDKITGKQKVVSLGSFATRMEAENALNEFILSNGKIELYDYTFKDVFEPMHKEMEGTIDNKSHAKYLTSYKKFEPLHNLKFRDLRFNDFIECFNGNTKSVQRRMITLIRKMFEFADIRDIKFHKNYGEVIKVNHMFTTDGKEIPRTLFTIDEIKAVESGEGNLINDMVMAYLYTGCRPIELFNLTNDKIDLKNNTLSVRAKTDAGDRKIPIHPRIRPIIERYYQNNDKHLFINPNTGGQYKYDAFSDRFKELNLGEHYPYDTRHTFATYMHFCGADDLTHKRIFGHADANVTEHYKKTLDSQAQHEIRKLQYVEPLVLD